jgi:choline transport protein
VALFLLSLPLTVGNSKAVISLDLACFMSTYMASLACLLYHRFREQGLEDKGLWSLGRWGLVVNVEALSYTAFVFFWSFWPDLTPVTLENLN